MFVLDLPAVPYADPWNQPLSERMAVLCRSKRRVAYFYEVANNSTFRYRAYNMAQVLNENLETDISASYFFLTDYAYFDELAEYADVLVICRSRYSAQLNHLIAKFRSRRKRVLFDVDDLVFDPQYAHLMVNTLGLNVQNEAVWDDFFAMISRMGRTLRLCDGAITTNEFLAERISDFSGLPVSVVPNFMNREQIAVSNLAYSKKERQEFKNDGRVVLAILADHHRIDLTMRYWSRP